MTLLLEAIREELSNHSDAKTKESFRRFFKHDIQNYGVKTPLVRKIARRHFKQIKTLEKGELFSFCEELFRSKFCEEAFVAANWLDWISHTFVPKDLATFERWIDRYIDDWAKCDSFCNHAMGSFLVNHPSIFPSLKKWTLSSNRPCCVNPQKKLSQAIPDFSGQKPTSLWHPQLVHLIHCKAGGLDFSPLIDKLPCLQRTSE